MDTLTRIEKKRISNKRWRNSPQGFKAHRIDQWKNKYGIIADYEWLYDIFMTANNCDYCNEELQTLEIKKLGAKSRCVDHCHTCGSVRGILCLVCNFQDHLKCDSCDSCD